MNYPLYVREFSMDRMFETDCQTYARSRYFPFPMKNALSRLSRYNGHIFSTDYILCPIYDDKTFQVGVTGSVEEKEESTCAILRELGEEIGVIPKVDSIRSVKLYEWRRFDKPDTEFTVYETNIKDCGFVSKDDDGVVFSQEIDRTDKKVGCYVYGIKKDVVDFLNRENIYVYGSDDHIIGIAAVCVSYLR